MAELCAAPAESGEGLAASAWAEPGWRLAALEYHASGGAITFAVTIAPADIERVSRLLHPLVSIDAAWRELNHPRMHPTPPATVEALVYAADARGRAAFQEPLNKERLARCDAAAKAELRTSIKKLVRGAA